MRIPILLATVLAHFQLSAAPLLLKVHTRGDETQQGGFTTIEAARDEIRNIKSNSSYPEDGVIVEIAPGLYPLANAIRFEAADSGLPNAPAIYRGSDCLKTILSAGIQISKLQEIKDDAVLNKIPLSARDHVQQFDLSSLTSGPLEGFSSGGAGFQGDKQNPVQLYQNNTRLPIARWPNKGYAKTGEIIGKVEQFRDRKDILTSYSGVFKHEDTERLRRWKTETDLWFDGKWFHHWADQRMPLKSIDLIEQTVALQNPETHAYGFRENRDFYVFNAISELDTPGEWAIDRKNQILYIWPIAPPSEAPLSLSMNQHVIDANNAKHLRIEKLTAANSTGSAINLTNCENITIIGSTIRQTGGWAVDINGGWNCQVLSSDLHHLGEGGCELHGGDRATLTPSGHRVENCHIHDIAQTVSTYRPGVSLNGTGASARHNLIYNTPHTALTFDGNDHIIEYNIIHDVALHASDTGAIYSCTRDWSKRGTIIRHNLVHALGSPLDGAGCRAYYFDDHTSGVTVHGNIATMASIGIHIGGGKDNSVTNNMILNCDTSIDYASRGTDSFKAQAAQNGARDGTYIATKQAPWNTEIWRSRYPEIPPIFDLDPVEAHFASGNEIENNLIAGSGGIRVQNRAYVMKTSTIAGNAIVDGDPGLSDIDSLDFSTSDLSSIEDLGDYTPIPYTKMGLYPDPWRPSPAFKYGPDVTPLSDIASAADLRGARKSAVIQSIEEGAIQIDGQASSGEWSENAKHKTHCQIAIAGNYCDKIGYSQVGYDGQAFFLFAKVVHETSKPLVMKGKWGKRDGLEIVIRDPRTGTSPTFLLHCYPDNSFEVIPVGNTTERQASRVQEAITFASKTNPQDWTLELRLPLDAMDMSTAELDRIAYNINIRRMADESWMAWARPGGSFWETHEAGFLQMPGFASDE
ncbi:right-handed parallel beta-helix repeat-containing protein [Puniceicoccaceae bacterium K14]|nr:right-handed parallel beta-helix repeat-containing protein [Puniceicoccaceae bacterium K14]